MRTSPYTFALPGADDITILEDVGQYPLELKLHALQCGWLHQEEDERFQVWSASTADGVQIVEAGIAELHARIHAWCSLAGHDRWARWAAGVREVYLSWGATRIVGLAEELESREGGREAYIAAYSIPADGSCCADIESSEVSHVSDEAEDEDDLFSEKYI